MALSFKDHVQQDQSTLAQVNLVVSQVNTLLATFCRAVNDAAQGTPYSHKVVQLSAFNDLEDGKLLQKFCVYNEHDSHKGADDLRRAQDARNSDRFVYAHKHGFPIPEGTVPSPGPLPVITASYTIAITTHRPNALSRFFGQTASPAIGIANQYLENVARAPGFNPKKFLVATPEDVANHPLINGMFQEIYKTLPETVRAKVCLNDIKTGMKPA
ncbi:hypothetical protein [Micavibrio aeruginosavorus]|uniref:hypothetical protein n=1 Tax=Micavibrio aeruginosavorus TaxID=349221 RepID=UPI003F4ACAEA